MANVRQLYALMAARARVRLPDGRVGHLVRVDTSFPECEVTAHVCIERDGDSEEVRVPAAVVQAPGGR